MYKIVKCVKSQDTENNFPFFKVLDENDPNYEEHIYESVDEAETARAKLSTDLIKWVLYKI
jgi:hypothetical protein